MKILQFGKFYPPSMGGTEQVMFETSEGVSRDGHTCDVLCSNKKASYIEDKFENYTVFRTGSYGIFLSTSITPQLIYKLWKLNSKYEIIHIHAPDPMAFLALFLVRPKAKIIVHWHLDIVRQHRTKKFFIPLQNWVLKFADKVIVTSKNYVQHSSDLKDVVSKVEILPLGTSNYSHLSDKKNVKDIHEQYKNKKIVLAIGRLVGYKGFKYLVESAKYLDDDFMILIAGTGYEKDNLEDIISSNKLQKKVKLLGHISEQEKYDYLQASYLFCLPSITKAEAFGVAIIEAMSFSKPIVSTNMFDSGISWVNKDGVTGIQVDTGSSKQLADAFRKIASDKSLYESMSKNSFRRYEKLFSDKKMIQSTIEIYKSVLR
ncbi:MAG: glycosyltransferase [Sulfurimonas sp.]|nr:glycosyltransferase [Sulfurimonas sp.]